MLIELEGFSVMQSLLLLQFISYCFGYENNLQPYQVKCNFSGFSLFCPDKDSSTICYYCRDGQAICNELPNSILRCSEGSVVLLESYCLSYDSKNSKIFAGRCPYNKPRKALVDVIYKNVAEFKCNDSLKRSGTLCGECEGDYYPLAYSYNLTCVSCPHGHINWLKVMLALLIPLTIFCFIVVAFKINVLSSHLHGFVFYSQAISHPVVGRVIFNGPYIQQRGYSIVIKLMMSFYSVWNLDIFRPFSPGICLPVKARDILWLDLAVGAYPLIVIAATYCIIQLYNNNVSIVVCIWNVVKRLFTKSWSISSSLIDAFAAFLILSSVKILSSSMDLLAATPVYELSDKKSISHQWRLYYDPTVQFFHDNYNKIFYICILVVLTFIALPFLILLLYPCRFFQRCLNRTTWNWNTLHTFMDAFQGCYKNGTEPGSHDFRWFSAVFFGGRVILALLYMFTFSSLYYVHAAIIVVMIVLLLILFQPFRPDVSGYAYSTTIFLMLLSMWYVSLSGFDVARFKDHTSVYTCFYTIAVVVPLIPIAGFCFIVVVRIKYFSNLVIV